MTNITLDDLRDDERRQYLPREGGPVWVELPPSVLHAKLRAWERPTVLMGYDAGTRSFHSKVIFPDQRSDHTSVAAEWNPKRDGVIPPSGHRPALAFSQAEAACREWAGKRFERWRRENRR